MDDQEIILKYLKEKDNEEEIITLLQKQKKMLADPGASSILLNEEYVSLIIKLVKKAKGKIKYHAFIILSNIGFYVEVRNFHEICKIAADGSNDKDGNVRQASFILIKKLNALMIAIPFINRLQSANAAEVDLFYESFRNLFYRLHFLFHNENDLKIKRKILHSLEIVVPKMDDMARFWDDQEDIRMINQVKKELNKGVQCGNRD